MDEQKLARVDPSWGDEQLRAWDGNFRSDGLLMTVCCDRDVGIEEFRRVLADFLEFRRGLGPAAEGISATDTE